MQKTKERIKLPGSELRAFNGDPEVKKKYLARLRQHKKLDEIIQGETGSDGKGCAVWCTLNNYNHKAYESELGIPEAIARLEDNIFEGLPVKESKLFPINFISAIPVGADLSGVPGKLMIWLLDEIVLPVTKDKKVRKVVENSSKLWKDFFAGKFKTQEEFNDATWAAGAAGDAAGAATWAAGAATWAAGAARATRDVRQDTYIKISKKLIQLLKEAPCNPLN